MLRWRVRLGELAAAGVAGTLGSVLPVVEQALRNDAAIQAGVELAVGDAVTALLTDTTLWQAVDGTVVALITEVLADAPVQAGGGCGGGCGGLGAAWWW